MFSIEPGTVTFNALHLLLLLLSLTFVQSFYGAGNTGLTNCMATSQPRKEFVIIVPVWKMEKLRFWKVGPTLWIDLHTHDLWRPAVNKN